MRRQLRLTQWRGERKKSATAVNLTRRTLRGELGNFVLVVSAAFVGVLFISVITVFVVSVGPSAA